jgi:hypothetical protein
VECERLLSVFERRILRCIFGAVHENGVWRKRYNNEVYESLMSLTSNILKKTDWAGQDMLYVWIITGQLRKYLTPSQ